MAIDVYLQIDGIKGESQDSAHQGWIELTSAQWGVLQPKSATASTAGGHTAERCEHRSITVTKLADLSSPLLMQTCSAGKTIPKAKLEFMRADSDGKPVKYYEVELENVLIGSVNQAAHEGGILQDSVALKFSKVKWKYTQQKISGGAGGNTAGGWAGYDRGATERLIGLFQAHPAVVKVYFNDLSIPIQVTWGINRRPQRTIGSCRSLSKGSRQRTSSTRCLPMTRKLVAEKRGRVAEVKRMSGAPSLPKTAIPVTSDLT